MNRFFLKFLTLSMFVFPLYSIALEYSFNEDIKLGNSGANVVSLQTFLLSSGYHIPSIESGAVNKGYFGKETMKAVKQYQIDHGISGTGYVGPITRKSLSSKSDSNSKVVTSNKVTNNLVSSTQGVGGSLAISLQATPSNSTSLSKGQEADIATYKIQAGSSDMKLGSINLDFDNRLWLYAESISILDNGNAIGQISNLNQNNFTELTVGSKYRLVVPVNLLIQRGMTKYITVHVKMLNTSDRSSGTLSITSIQTRALDTTGVSDNQTLNSTRNFNYSGINHGGVIITLDPNSPPNMLVPISTAVITENIPIAIVDMLSQGVDTTIRSASLYLNTSVDGMTSITTLVRDMKIQVGDLVYSADSIGPYSVDYGTSVVTFSNMAIPLPKDKAVPVTILLSINPSTSNSLDGISASTTLVASGTNGGTSNNPVIEDSSHNTISANAGAFLSSDITFSARDSSVNYDADVKAILGTPVTSNGATTAYPVSFVFSITAGNNTLYVSADPNQALSTSSTGLASNSLAYLPISGLSLSPGNLAGDTNTSNLSGYYVIPAGSSRKFTYSGVIRNTNGTSGLKTFQINGIKYGTSSDNLTANTVVYYNYSILKVSPVF